MELAEQEAENSFPTGSANTASGGRTLSSSRQRVTTKITAGWQSGQLQNSGSEVETTEKTKGQAVGIVAELQLEVRAPEC